VGAHGRGQASIEKTVVGIVPEVAGVAKRADQRNRAVDARRHTQQVVVGEVADDDVASCGQTGDCSEIRSKVGNRAFLDEAGLGPRDVFETSLEVATADEEKPRVDPGTVKGTTVELCHSTRASPLVGKDNHAYSHRQSIADGSLLTALQELGKALLWG